MAHQPFDRGWLKNVGFCLAQAGPVDSVYFHDVDTLPRDPRWRYPVVPRGQVVHLYGHRHCLGGIVGVDPAVFWEMGGFTHSIRWGGEDRHLQVSCERARIPIDRSKFHARFYSDSVVELNDYGQPEAPQELRVQLARKWAQATVQPYRPGELHTVAYKLEAQLTTAARVRHFLVKK